MAKIDLVYDTLREMIVAGELPPGSPIDKAGLADRLGASRQPVSGAIDRLAFEGLVEVIPQHGSFVSKLDQAGIADWFLVRAGLEAEFAARFAGDERAPLAALDRNIRYQAVAFKAGDLAGFHELDLGFHAIITGFTISPEAHAVLSRAEANLGRVRRLLLPEPGRAVKTLAEHRAIFEALERRDCGAAAAAMRGHISSVAGLFQRFIEGHPGAVLGRRR